MERDRPLLCMENINERRTISVCKEFCDLLIFSYSAIWEWYKLPCFIFPYFIYTFFIGWSHCKEVKMIFCFTILLTTLALLFPAFRKWESWENQNFLAPKVSLLVVWRKQNSSMKNKRYFFFIWHSSVGKLL